MKIRSMKYYFQEAIKSLFKNNLMSVASIITVASCIFIFILSYCLASNVDYLLEQLEDSIMISVFIDDKLTDKEVAALKEKISATEHVVKIEYTSSEEALKKMSDELGDSTGLMDGLADDNPLPRSFDIYYDNAINQKSVVSALNNLLKQGNGITRIKHFSTDTLIKANNIIRLFSIFIIIGMGIISIVIITNTIKLTVNNRKNEINIMKYVGATDWFIRWPFIIEGMIIGAIGAAIPLAISVFIYRNASISFQQFFDGMVEYKLKTAVSVFYFLIPVSLFLGISIGVIGSAMSIRKHLKV